MLVPRSIPKYDVEVDHTLDPISFFDFTYQRTSQILLKSLIEMSNKKYASIQHTIHETAFLWLATKPNHAPIYIFAAMHEVNFDFEDIFGDVFRNILSKVAVCFNENVDYDVLDACKDMTDRVSSIHQFDTLIGALACMMNVKLHALEDEQIRKLIEGKRYSFNLAFTNTDVHTLTKDTRNYLQNITFNRKTSTYTHADQRSAFWMMDILEESNNGNPALVVCGALHTVGKFGLPNLLHHEGYSLTPLMKKAPIPRSKIMKILLCESKGLSIFKPRPLLLEYKKSQSSDENTKSISP